MYRVIEMYGKDEPWWFFDGWEANIVSVQHFDNYYAALKYYKRQWLKLADSFPFYKSRSDLMSIFWDAGDLRWCEECGDSVQQYHSLALLENDTVIPKEKMQPGYNKQNSEEEQRACSLTFK